MNVWDRVDRFEGTGLDTTLWIPQYLPHWTTAERSAARYRLTSRGLELRIEYDQPAWRPLDGDFRTSHIQTGHWDGQHRIGRDLAITGSRPTALLWAPPSGALEVVASASGDPACMLGIWLVGHEASGPEDSGELCVAEVFGRAVSATRSTVRTGIKAHHDPRLEDRIVDVELDLDATAPHTYGAAWGTDGATVTVDGIEVFRTTQVLGYPVQLMIDLWEFPAGRRDPAAYPKTAVIRQVRLRAG